MKASKKKQNIIICRDKNSMREKENERRDRMRSRERWREKASWREGVYMKRKTDRDKDNKERASKIIKKERER